MYLVLLAFGAVLTVAGFILGTSGISIHDRAFDTSLLTPGVVAAAGGLILIGLGLGLRVLQRIEVALTARPMPRPVRPGEPAAATEASTEPARSPFPPKPEIRPQPLPTAAPAAPAEAKAPQHLRLQFPTLARLDSALVVQESDVLRPPPASLRLDEAVGELNRGRTVRQKNGGTAARIAPRLDVSARPATPSERPKGPAFDALWPKGPQPVAASQPASTPAAAVAAVEPEQSNQLALDAAGTPAQDEAPAPVSILKSGVVDGMAYTLYSDGSIEAQLPQGTLRFGSITELRNHIEHSPPDAATS